jgi:hypothetical protein
MRHADVPSAAWPTVRAGFTDCVATMIAGRNEPVVFESVAFAIAET